MTPEEKDEMFAREVLEREIIQLQNTLKTGEVSLDKKSDIIGKINLLKNAQELLRRCSEYDVFPKAIWRRVPPPQHEWSEYRLMEDNDSDNKEYWTELEHIRLNGGEVVIG